FNTEQPKNSHGFTHVHHFYTKRNLHVISKLVSLASASQFKHIFMGSIRSSLSYCTKMVKTNVKRLLNGGGLFALGTVGGTLYIPSINAERNNLDAIKNKINIPNIL